MGILIDVNGELPLTTVILFMSLVSMVLGGVIAFFSSRIPLKPINNLINKMNRLAAGDFKARLHFGNVLSSHSAFNEISTSFNKMAEELENTELLRNDFINNFSHEFKTPIVSITGFAGLLSKGNLTEEQKAVYIRSIEEESKRLAAMATNMLNLTKVENQTILTDISSFNLSEQIRSAVLLLEDRWTRKNIDLQPDFDEYIIAFAKNTSKRYMGSVKRAETLETITMTIFDSLKKRSGLSKRDGMLLRIAAILHDCGKFISLYNLAECSYNIIMSTEIIGLSYKEREIVANVVKFNHEDFESYEEIASSQLISSDQYLRITKLLAILRVANGLDRSHKQKFKDISVNIKEKEFIITVNTDKDITLEMGLLKARANFFEEVFYLKPIIKQQKTK